jgi:hypothetical protein
MTGKMAATAILPAIPYGKEIAMKNLPQVVRNRKIVVIVAVILSLLTIYLPYTPQSRVSGKALKPAALKNGSQNSIEARTIERKSVSGEVLSRLQVVLGNTPREAQFKVEGIQPYTQARIAATGKVKISGNNLVVQIKDARNGTELSFKLTIEPAKPEQVTAKLLLNEILHKFTFYIERAKALTNEMQKLVAEGRIKEAAKLGAQLRETLSPIQDYFAFTRQVENSSAFDAIAAIASAITTASADEISSNPALSAISSAVKIFAPSVWKAASSGEITSSTQQGQMIKVSHTARSRNGLHSSSQTVTICCSVCSALLGGGIYGCLVPLNRSCIYDWGWDPDACDLLSVACAGGVAALAVECFQNCDESC